jgi:hypothetical protein
VAGVKVVAGTVAAEREEVVTAVEVLVGEKEVAVMAVD